MIESPPRAVVEELAVRPAIEPADNQFNLALVLNGTVSSGAYTAGVLDFLVEALDAMERAQESGEAAIDGVPVVRHKVKLALAAGASGGGVCAAILARVLAREFPHVRADTPPGVAKDNPFYDTWVNKLAIESFSRDDDLRDGIRSALNAKILDEAGDGIVAFRGVPLGTGISPKTRSYVHDPFRAIFTLFNLRGVPYRIAYDSSWEGAQYFTDHSDWISFRVTSNAELKPVPNEFTVRDNPNGPDEVDWNRLKDFAIATAAFPGGLAARPLKRPVTHYQYRVATVPAEDNRVSDAWRLLEPDFEAMHVTGAGEILSFVSVDGGTANNAPFEIARTRLSGLTGRNPRSPREAHAGVMLIDPFAVTPDLASPGSDALLGALFGTLGGLLNQARFSTADLLLALQDDVCSRFMISPYSGRGRGNPAIATSGLSAFLGFFDASYRRHDYLLGRSNCQLYLKQEFCLHPENPVFDQSEDPGPHIFQADGVPWRPLIPLYYQAADRQVVPEWPKNSFDEPEIRKLVHRRLGALVDKATDSLDISGWLTRAAVEAFVDPLIRDKLVDKIMPILMEEVRKHGL